MTRFRLLCLLALASLLSACFPPDELPEDSFSLSAIPATVSLAPGESGGSYLALERAESFREPIEVTVLGLDAARGVQVTLGPAPVYGESSALAFSLDADAPPQRLELSVLARSRNLEKTTPLTLTVGPREDAGPATVSGRVTTANAEIAIEAPTFGIQAFGEAASAGTAQQGDAQQGDGDATQDGAQDGAQGAYAPGELLVQYQDAPEAGEALGPADLRYLLTAQAVGEDYLLEPLRAGEPGRPDLVRVPDGQDPKRLAASLSRDPRVRYAEPNYYLRTAALPDDPLLNEQWAAAAAGLPVAWAQETGAGSPVVVAVIDSGFDLQHQDLAPRLLPGYDFCSKLNGSCSAAGTPTSDDPSFGSFQNAHGSHVAGTLGAVGGNGLGVTGAAYGSSIRLLPVKIFNGNGGGATTSSFIDGIRWAAGLGVTTTDGKRVRNPNPARVINLSLGVDRPSTAMQGAIDEARRRGAVIIAATGNAGADRVWSPAAADGVIGVGSHNQSFTRSCFSNYGLPAGPNGPGGVDIVAGGGETCGVRQSIVSTVPEDAYGYLVGTSMAAPLVSGVAALILSRFPELSVEEVEARLLETAFFDARYMSAEEYGAGVLRADRALGLAGPGDPVIVRSLGSERTGVAVLDLYGGSFPYTLPGLPTGNASLRAGPDSPGSLRGARSLALRAGVTEADIPLEYEP